MKLPRFIQCAPALLCLSAAAQLSAQAPFNGTIEVIQNDAGNNTSSISTSLSKGSSAGIIIDGSRSNKGDYTLNFPPANDVADGVLLTSIAENGRDNSATGDPVGTFYPTSSIDITGSEYYAAIYRSDPPADNAEFNINTSFAYFPFSDWLAGHARNDFNGGAITTLNASSGIDLGAGQEFVDNGDGTFELDLTALGASSQNGILLVNGGKNEDNYALSRANGDGTFTIYNHDNGVNGAVYERDPVAFAYIPTSRVGSGGLAAMGRVLSSSASGTNASTQAAAGGFVAYRDSTGLWVLQLNRFGAENGTLLISPEGGDPFNLDNTISAEYVGNRIWKIESRDLPNYNLQNGASDTEPMFSFAFFVNQTYVNASATGANDGTSWANAHTSLQDALENAIPGQAIWVAEGTYYPDESFESSNAPLDDSDDRNATFALKSGVKIYGGFPATGNPTFADRDPAAHETILSGDIDKDDGADFANNGGDAYHVLTADGVNAEALLDGFTIAAGNADSTAAVRIGGGLNCFNSASPVFENCLFEGNAAIKGGAVRLFGASPTFQDCMFLGNSAQSGGGAFYTEGSVAVPKLTNCVFQGNNSGGAGGAFSNVGSAAPVFTNNIFIGNRATQYGGALANESSSAPVLVNCSFQGNAAGLDGGAIDNFTNVSLTLTNCIIWNNSETGSTATASASVSSDGTSSVTYTHSLVQNINLSGTGTNNLDGTDPANDPSFIVEVDPLAAPVYSGGDLRLRASTPLLDRGSFVFGSPATDLGGNPRLSNVNVELGAYELKITYVDVGRTAGEFDGSSWFNAFDLLQEALKAAQPGDILFVAEGTYYPDRFVDAFDILRDSDDRNATFVLKSGVEVYGSFPAGGSFADRDPVAHETILSGEIDQNDGSGGDNTGNALHVLTADGTSGEAHLDGFTVAAGNENQSGGGGALHITNGSEISFAGCTFEANRASPHGGAILVRDSSVSLKTCSFTGNSAGVAGGAISGEGSELYLDQCTFGNNISGTRGGAIRVVDSSILSITGSSFLGNESGFGGAIHSKVSSSTLVRCSFEDNFAEDGGGAIDSEDGNLILTNCSFRGNHSGGNAGAVANGGLSASFTNCLFLGNSADATGGAVRNYYISPDITNCVFQGNSAGDAGGAIHNTGESAPNLANCIIWNNAADGTTDTAEASVSSNNDPGFSPSYSHSLVQNIDLSAIGTNNLDGTDPLNNPRFVSEVDPLTAPIATGGDLRLFIDSPALDAGDNSENSESTDLAGNARIQNSLIDLGAYEGFVNDPALLWPTDFDLDNRPYGIEIATATDPEVADRDPLGSFVVQSDGLPVLQFTRNTSAPVNFELKIMRSPDLSAGSYVEIFRISGANPGLDTEGGNQFTTGDGGTFVTFGDENPPADKAFYRLGAELIGF